jgi:hypothetical protein
MSAEEQEEVEVKEQDVFYGETELAPQSGHCFKCKKITQFENLNLSESKNHRRRISGNCVDCKKPVSKFVKKTQ